MGAKIQDNVPCGKTVTVGYRFPLGPVFWGQSSGQIDGRENGSLGLGWFYGVIARCYKLLSEKGHV